MNEKLMKCGYDICRIIGNSINNKNICNYSELPSEDMILYFAESHNLVSLVGSSLKLADLNNPEFSKLFQKSNSAVFKQMKADILSERISKLFSTAKIRHIILKGTQLQQFYPENMIRTSNDIDIYISPSQSELACEILKTENFEFISLNNEDIEFKKEPRYYFEIHTSMGGFTDKHKKILQKLADNAENVENFRFALNQSDCYIYTLYHLYKHFVISGAGVRMFLDMYMLEKADKLDNNYIDNILKKLGIYQFDKTVRKVNRVLFENEKPTEELSEVIEFIFKSGTFGQSSTQKAMKHINNNAIKKNKINKLMNEFGFDFNSMKNRYPVLSKFPLLFPFCCIYRCISGIIFRHNIAQKAVKEYYNVSDSEILQLERILKISGIK